MTAQEAINLINVGGTDHLRKKLKKYGLEDRMKILRDCIPYVSSSGKSLKFFKENFSKEIGALLTTNNNIEKAVELYRKAEYK